MNPGAFHDNVDSSKLACNEKAYRRFTRADCNRVTLSLLRTSDEIDQPDSYYLAASIIKVKPCDQQKTYTFKNAAQKMKKNNATMILFKELYDKGETFYAFLDPQELIQAMNHLQDDYWQGTNVLLLDPVYKTQYKENAVIELANPLFPLSRLKPTFTLHTLLPVENKLTDNIESAVANEIYTLR